MANRKSKSNGQSQAPKQGAGGRASRSSNPQATNKPRSVATAHRDCTAAPRPPQPQATAHRPSNGTKYQNAGNGAPKVQGANGSNFVRAEAMSGPRASQDRSVNQGTPKRNGSGLNNGPQKAQAQPHNSSKNEAPKPKHSQVLFGGHSSASNSALTWSNHIREQGVPKPIANDVAANQSGHTQPHAQKAQNHAPTPPKEPTFFPMSLAHQQHSGKNTASHTFPKVQVATTHAQQPSRGGQSSAPRAQGSEKPSQTSQQQHKCRKDTPPKPSTNKRNPPTEGFLSTMFSLFSTGSEAPGSPSHKSQHAQQGHSQPHAPKAQIPAPTPKKGELYPISKSLGAHDTPPKHSTNKGNPPTEGFLSTLFSYFSTGSEAPKSPSHKAQHAQQGHTEPHAPKAQIPAPTPKKGEL
ncbi:hypothetical protein B0H34DRAFT_651398 [Crassisporium funariophilum]|nr:hypothetical protein B0H34DRAFT_651398 [Crassisporium funariophilum]